MKKEYKIKKKTERFVCVLNFTLWWGSLISFVSHITLQKQSKLFRRENFEQGVKKCRLAGILLKFLESGNTREQRVFIIFICFLVLNLKYFFFLVQVFNQNISFSH